MDTKLQKPSDGKLRFYPSALLIAGLLAVPACSKHTPADRAAPSGPPRVVLEKPKWHAFEKTIEQPGWITAYEQAPLYTKISGYVKEVKVDIGSPVDKGDVLAELRVPEMVEELKHKEIAVTQARIEIKQAEKALDLAHARFDTATSLVKESKSEQKRARAQHERWRSECARLEKLVAGRVIDEQIRDETLNQCKAAEAAWELAGAKIESADALRKESKANCEKAEADLEAARNRLAGAQAQHRHMAALLDYATIRAPFKGVVSQRHVDTGHFLQPGTSSNGHKDEPLFVVVRTDLVRIFLDVPESDAVWVSKGASARVRVQALNDKVFEGKVAGTSWALEPGQRTLRTEVDFSNPLEELRPGMYAYASISITRAKSLTVPAGAIVSRDGRTYCFLESDNKALRTAVKIGARQGALVEVLKRQVRSTAGDESRWEDFNGEEWVVQSNSDRLSDGQPIAREKAGEP